MEHVPSPSLPAGHIACLQSLSIYYCPKAATLLSRCPNLLLFMVLPNCTDLINISQYIFQMQISTVIKVTLHVTVIAVTSARLWSWTDTTDSPIRKCPGVKESKVRSSLQFHFDKVLCKIVHRLNLHNKLFIVDKVHSLYSIFPSATHMWRIWQNKVEVGALCEANLFEFGLCAVMWDSIYQILCNH